MWSNQESIRTGPGRAHLGIRPPQFGGILLQNRIYSKEKSDFAVQSNSACHITTQACRTCGRLIQSREEILFQRGASPRPHLGARLWLRWVGFHWESDSKMRAKAQEWLSE